MSRSKIVRDPDHIKKVKRLTVTRRQTQTQLTELRRKQVRLKHITNKVQVRGWSSLTVEESHFLEMLHTKYPGLFEN